MNLPEPKQSSSDVLHFDYRFKFVMVGDSAVGKSSLLRRFTENYFEDNHKTTIGVDYRAKEISLTEGKWAKVCLWDTAGQERFRTIGNAYYRGARAVIVVYDVTDGSSFESVRTWLQQVGEHAPANIPVLLVGNKSDLELKRVVSTQQGKALANLMGMDFIETSARTAERVEEAFTTLALRVKSRVDKEQPKQRSSVVPESNVESIVRLTLPSGLAHGCC